MSDQTINTFIYADDTKVSKQLTSLLRDSEYTVSYVASDIPGLLSIPLADTPTILLMSVLRCDEDLLSILKILYEQHPIPVVIFTEQYDVLNIQKAIEAGVSAYVVDGLLTHRLFPVLSLALARFQQIQGLVKQVGELRTQLADRKVIDRAKGIVMRELRLSEDEAYKLMRTTAMNRNVKLASLSEQVIQQNGLPDVWVPSSSVAS